MKFILIFIGISSIFYTGLSLRCFQCDDTRSNPLIFGAATCDAPEVVVCTGGETCKKVSGYHGDNFFVIKGCGNNLALSLLKCDTTEEGATVYCCSNGDFCNGSETILKNNFLFWSFLLFSISKLLF